MNKLLIICGPTASGKTSLAFELARKFNGELISADSRQVYKGMDIVTGKEVDTAIRTWVLDVVEPDYNFNVSEYYDLAWKAIENIWQRGKLAILVGGTGFYIKAVLDGIGTLGVEPDWKLRRELDKLTVEQLQARLKKMNKKRWEVMNQSDRKNPRRLVRAIEVVSNLYIGGVPSEHPRGGRMDSSGVNLLWIGLTADFKRLYKRIDQRVDERVKLGAVEETKRLAKKYGWEIPSMTGQGYRELRDYVEGKISLDAALQRWKFAEHEYARKQMTWFKKDKRIEWFDISDSKFQKKVEEMVREWYHRT